MQRKDLPESLVQFVCKHRSAMCYQGSDIIDLSLNPPEKALVVSVDERPGIQEPARTGGYVETDSGKTIQGFKRKVPRAVSSLLAAVVRWGGKV